MRRACLIVLLLPALAGAGCGAPDGTTPPACLEGFESYLAALGRVPGAARLRGGVPISDCLVENQSGGDIANVGEAMLRAAYRLNADGRADPAPAPGILELGYLLGAATHAAESTEGIHAELIRRLNAAALYSTPERPLAPSMQAYREGFKIGHASG